MAYTLCCAFGFYLFHFLIVNLSKVTNFAFNYLGFFQEVIMNKNKLPVRFTGQHFTIDKVLIEDAIKQSRINQNDTVSVS